MLNIKHLKMGRLNAMAIFISLSFLSMSSKPEKIDDGYYAFIVLDGVWKDNKTAYASQIIYYPGYANCNKIEDSYFFNKAKRIFSDYLKANYSNIFPNGEYNNLTLIQHKKFSTYDRLTSRSQAEQRMTEWVANQKEQGYSVVLTKFAYDCSNY